MRAFTGRLYRGNDSDATLLELLRENHRGSFRAIFTDMASKDGAEVQGHVVNSNANTGTFRMHRVLSPAMPALMQAPPASAGNLTIDLPECFDGTGRTGRICDTGRIIKMGEEAYRS